jgi:hypothetical protein
MNPLHSIVARLSHRRALLALILMIGIAGTGTGLGTLAFFTTSAQSNSNVFMTGAIELGLTDANETSLDTITASTGATNDDWRPGEVRYAYINVDNSGTLSMTYDLRYTADDSGATPDGANAHLTEFLDLSIKSGGTDAECNATDWGTIPTTIITDQDLSILGSVLTSDRALAATGAGDTENLCLKMVFENTTGGAENAAQGGTATIDFIFEGEQIAAGG